MVSLVLRFASSPLLMAGYLTFNRAFQTVIFDGAERGPLPFAFSQAILYYPPALLKRR